MFLALMRSLLLTEDSHSGVAFVPNRILALLCDLASFISASAVLLIPGVEVPTSSWESEQMRGLELGHFRGIVKVVVHTHSFSTCRWLYVLQGQQALPDCQEA